LSANQIPVSQVPGIEVVQQWLASIDADLSVVDAAKDLPFDSYTLEFEGHGRVARATFQRSYLDDLRDNPTAPNSRYSQELYGLLNNEVKPLIESEGLILFNESALKYKLLHFIFEESKNNRSSHKYNTIGKSGPGMFEQSLRVTLSKEEKETLIWAWSELVRLRLITPTGQDLVNPDDWVLVTDRGRAAIEGKTYLEYDEAAVFIPKGEVYTAFRKIMEIIQQARTDIIVIDPYADEVVLDMFSALPASVSIKLLTTHTKPTFILACKKLYQQRGNLQVRTSSHFHDRFIVLDGVACYQSGCSFNHAGAKATVIAKQQDQVRDKVKEEFDSAWLSATPIT
jgi:hypothetical protein